MSTALAATRTTHTDTPLTRLRWVLSDAWVVARRDILHWRRQPGSVIVGWAFPVMIVLMFGFLFGGAIRVPDNGAYFDFLMPGMFALAMLFGFEATMLAVTTDAAKGVTDRFRSMPMSQSAVVMGRCIADMLNSVVGLAVLVVTGLILGWRWHGRWGDALTAFGLLLLLRFALLWVGIYLGLTAKGPEASTSVQILIWPFGFLSNVFVDPATMPAWLGAIARWNPLSVTASATRELFANPGWGQDSWIAENAVGMAIVIPLLIIVIFLPLSANKYRTLSR